MQLFHVPFFGKRPNVSHMRVWFSDMFIHWPKDLGVGKLGVHGHQMKFLGYPDGTAGYKAYDPETHKVSITRAPIFREEARPSPTMVFESADDISDNDTAAAPTGGAATVPASDPATPFPMPPPLPHPRLLPPPPP